MKNENEIAWCLTESGDTVRSLRKKAGLTQDEFGEVLGVGQNRVTSIECGRRAMSGRELLIASEYFNISADELLRTDFADKREVSRLFYLLNKHTQNEVLEFIRFKYQQQVDKSF